MLHLLLVFGGLLHTAAASALPGMAAAAASALPGMLAEPPAGVG